MRGNFILYIVFYFLFGVHLNLFSQNITNLPDSLAQKSFDELTDLFYSSKPDTLKCIFYAKAKYYKALVEKDTMEMIGSKYLLADIKNNDDIYLNFCDSLIEVCKKRPSKNFPAAIFLDKSKFNFQRRKNHLSINELISAKTYLVNQKNDSLNAIRLLMMGLLKSSIGKTEDALKHYKNSYILLKNKNLPFKNNDFLSLPANISLIYIRLNKLDSALYYINQAHNLYENINDKTFLDFSFYVLGEVYFKKKRYLLALENYEKSIRGFIDDENYYGITKVYSKIGKTYEKLNNSKKSLKFHLRADSIFVQRNIKTPWLKFTFSFLINHYKESNDIEKQLLYINKLLEIKEFELTEKNKIQETFTNEFDIPNLLAERKRIIKELEATSKRNTLLYSGLLLISLGMIGYQIHKKRSYKKRFLALMNQEQIVASKTSENDMAEKSLISEEIVSEILAHLTNFENNHGFIDSSLSLQKLATTFHTNANYLSKVINQHKHTTFSNYINQLRIDYAVQQLKLNPLWRKYTVKAIASEVGFNNAESFSKAFYKYTELKPSYFIKELEKQQLESKA